MKTFTIADVAKATGVNKQTVRRRARELGIYDEMAPRDARGTMVMTAEQASILSDAVTKAVPEAMGAISEAAGQERAQEMRDAYVSALKDTIAAKDALVEDLRGQVERLRMEKDAEVAALTEQLAKKEAEFRRLQDYARKLEHAHWWEKRGIINAFGALPPASE